MGLKELTQVWGVSGHEWKVSDYIAEEVKDYADSIIRDAIGNLIVLKKGNGENKKKIMSAAHMDEIGLSIIKILDDGMIQVKQMGGVSPHSAYTHRVQFENGIIGTVGCSCDLDQLKPRQINKLYVDIGCSSKEETEKYVKVGDNAMFIGEFVELAGGRKVMSKAFDDRIGCHMQIEALKRMGTPYHDVYFVFTVQEEVGLFGAITSSEYVKPDLGIALDVTGSFDVPNDKEGNAVLGGGAAIKINDSCVICDDKMVAAMIDCAEKNNIKYQLDALAGGGTDAGGINRSNEGVKAVGISIATRYCHSPSSILSLDDLEDCINLLVKYTESPLEIVTREVIK